MRFSCHAKYVRITVLAFVSLAFAICSFAQGSVGTLHGTVTDPSGGAVGNISVVVTSSAGKVSVATTNRQGAYEVKGLAPGKYKVEALAKGFAAYAKQDVEIATGQILELDIPLVIEEQQQKVTVSSDAPTVDVSPQNNAGAVVISGKELDALSDDPDELESDLQALAGPSAGPNGGQMYIDGFTAGQLPPKSSIREIRINQNPFSSEYDKLGYGRIEILTKPGTDKFHGEAEVMGNDSAFNSKNPFAPANQPGYDRLMYNGSVGGPLSKKASFFFSAQRRDINDLGIVNPAAVLDQNNNIVTNFVEAVPNNLTRTNIGPRLDYQLTKNNTVTVRYQYWRNSSTNQGVSGFSLPSQGYNAIGTEQTLQATDTQMFGASVVNETHFQYIRETSTQNPESTAPTVNVTGAFTGGGSSGGVSTGTGNRYEIQNYTSIAKGKHYLKFGIRLRDDSEASFSPAGFNGSFTFSSINEYQIAEQSLSNNVPIPPQDLPTQLTINRPINAGIPTISASLIDTGLYVQDDWRFRPNLTISGGLRFETQNHLSDHADWAPRAAIAWGLARKGAVPKTVLRLGWGMFYDRFPEGDVLELQRMSGTIENSYTVNLPAAACFPDPTVGACPLVASSGTATTYINNQGLRTPYTMQTALSLEQQVTKVAKVSVTYMNSRGLHQFFTNNINAPLPGTYPIGDPSLGTPGYNALDGPVYQYEAGGIFKENQLIANVTVRAGAKVTLSGYYTLSYANGDTSGGFPSNPYNLNQDYGPTAYSVRNRAFLFGSIALPYGLRASPFMIVSSGSPYSVTLPPPYDYVGSRIFNQRPGFVSAAACPTVTINSTLYCTPLGTFDISPNAAEMPINSFVGPGSFTLNLRLSKTFGFGGSAESSGGGGRGGRGGGGGGRRGGPFGGGGGFGGFGGGPSQRYNLTFSVNARNLLNNVNLAIPDATLGSPKFGQSLGIGGGGFGRGGGSSSASNRVVELQASFTF